MTHDLVADIRAAAEIVRKATARIPRTVVLGATVQAEVMALACAQPDEFFWDAKIMGTPPDTLRVRLVDRKGFFRIVDLGTA